MACLRAFFRIVDCLDVPKIWDSTILLSSIFLVFNITAVPQSYRTLHTGRMFFLFLLLYIVSTNNFDGKVRKTKDGYRSTKHNGNGIGLAAIAAAAEKYGGSAQASNSATEFFVDVALKI